MDCGLDFVGSLFVGSLVLLVMVLGCLGLFVVVCHLVFVFGA